MGRCRWDGPFQMYCMLLNAIFCFLFPLRYSYLLFWGDFLLYYLIQVICFSSWNNRFSSKAAISRDLEKFTKLEFGFIPGFRHNLVHGCTEISLSRFAVGCSNLKNLEMFWRSLDFRIKKSLTLSTAPGWAKIKLYLLVLSISCIHIFRNRSRELSICVYQGYEFSMNLNDKKSSMSTQWKIELKI